MSSSKPPPRSPLEGLSGISGLRRLDSPVQQRLRSFLDSGQAQAAKPQRPPPDIPAILELAQVDMAKGRPAQAAQTFRRVLSVDPRNFGAWRGLGVALDALRDQVGAINAYGHAFELKPQADLARRLSALLLEAGRTEDAIACLNRAADVEGRTVDGHLARARAFLLGRRYAEAGHEARKALVRAPRNARALLFLGEISGLAGQLEQARDSFRRLVEVAPENAQAYFNLVHVGRVSESDRPVLRSIDALLQKGGQQDDARMRLYFALGKGFDDLGESVEAIKAFDAGNEIRARLFPMDHAAYRTLEDWLVTSFSASEMRKFAGAGSSDERPVFVLGLPRSGTTLAEQILSAHPAIAAGDELPFWPGRGPGWQLAQAGGNAANWLGKLAGVYGAVLSGISGTALRVTDKNPFNFYWIGLIHMALPQARFIHCRRHPVATCLSMYMTHFATRADYAGSRSDLVFLYRLYERLMAHWREVIPADRLLEIDYEAVVTNREAQARRLVAFCGVDWDPACLAPERNERTVQTASVWQVRQPVYTSSVDRWRRYEPWLGELRELLPA